MANGDAADRVVVVGVDDPDLGTSLEGRAVFEVPDPDSALAAVADGEASCLVVGPGVEGQAPKDLVAALVQGGATVPVVAVTDAPEAALDAGATEVALPTTPGTVLARRVENVARSDGAAAATLAALEETARELMAATDRATVARIAVEAAGDVFGRPAAGVQHYDPETDALEPLWWSEAARELVEQPRRYTADDPVPWGVFRSGEPRYVPDVAALAPDERTDREIIVRSSVMVPLGNHGLFIVSSTEPEDFDADDRRFIEVLAAGVEAALDRLEREHYLTDIHDVATELATADSPTAVYERTVEAAASLLEFDDCVVLAEREGLLEPVAAASDAVAAASSVYHVGEGYAGRTYEAGQTVVVDDMASDGATDRSAPYRSLLSVPIGDWGVFQAGHRRPGRFDDADRERAEVLASHAAAALSRLASERRVRQQEEGFRRLFDATPLPLVHAGVDGAVPVVRTVNDAFAETFGVDADAVVGESVNDIVAAEERRDAATGISELIADGETVEREVVRTTVDGQRRFLLRVLPLDRDEHREAIAVYVDVTERSEREHLLTELHDVATDIEACESVLEVCERTVEAAEHLLEFDYCSLSLDEDGVLVPTVVSEGVKPEWVRPFSHDDGVHGAVFRTGEPRIVDDFRDDHDSEDPKGPFVSGLAIPLGDHGVFMAVDEEAGAFDETDLQLGSLLMGHAAEALDSLAWAGDLETEQARFRRLFDLLEAPAVHSRDAVHGPVVIAVNEAFESTFGFDAEAIVGRELDDFVVPERHKGEAERLADRARSGERVDQRVTRRTVDGEREFRLRLVPVEGVGETIGIYRPVTDDGDRDSGTLADAEREADHRTDGRGHGADSPD